MNFLRQKISRTVIEDASIDIHTHIKRLMMAEIFKNIDVPVNGQMFFNFKIVDWDTQMTESNQNIHHLIDQCLRQQIRIYDLYYEMKEN